MPIHVPLPIALPHRLCRLTEGASILALQRLPQLQALELSDVAGPTAAQLDDTLRRCVCMVVRVMLVSPVLVVISSGQAGCHASQAAVVSALDCNPAPNPAPRSLTALHLLSVQSHSPACKTPALRSLACLPRIRRLAVAQAHQLQSFVGLTNLGSLRGEAAGEEGAPGVHALACTGAAVHVCSTCHGTPARLSLSE